MLGLYFIWVWSLCLSDNSSSTTRWILLKIRVERSKFNLSKMSRGQEDIAGSYKTSYIGIKSIK